MAMVFIDGFDYYTTVLDKWSNRNASALVARAARTGAQGMECHQPGSFLNQEWTDVRDLPTTHSGTVFGVAARYWSGLSTPGGNPFIKLYGGGSSSMLTLNLNGSFNIVVKNGAGTTLGTTSSPVHTGWNYIEVKVVCHSSAGTVDVQLDSANVLSLTGVNTNTNGNGHVDGIFLGSFDEGGSIFVGTDFDDLYMFNMSGTSNIDFVGETQVDTKFVTNSGAATNWDVSGVASNYLAVDDALPNDNTDYIYSSDIGTTDTYQFGDMDADVTYAGVAVNMQGIKDGNGTRTLAAIAQGTGTASTGTAETLTTSYITHWHIFETDPDTSSAWTSSTVNAAEFGVKVNS